MWDASRTLNTLHNRTLKYVKLQSPVSHWEQQIPKHKLQWKAQQITEFRSGTISSARLTEPHGSQHVQLTGFPIVDRNAKKMSVLTLTFYWQKYILLNNCDRLTQDNWERTTQTHSLNPATDQDSSPFRCVQNSLFTQFSFLRQFGVAQWKNFHIKHFVKQMSNSTFRSLSPFSWLCLKIQK